MIATIARKEFTEMVRDGRFRIAAGIVALLLLAALATGWSHYAQVRKQHEQAQQAMRDFWVKQGEKNPHSAAHYGIYAFKPKMSLAVVDRGVDPYTGVAVWLEAHKQNEFRYRPARDANFLARFGELTAASVLQLLLPLLIIVLTFSAFAGEREQGTLRQLLSLGVEPRALAFGKAGGVAAALLLLLVPATIAGVIALFLASGSQGMAASLSRMALMVGFYLLYFIVFIALALFVSARTASARVALVLLLGFWIVNGLIGPRAASDFAKQLHPAPSAFEFQKKINEDIENGVDGHNPYDKRAEELKTAVLKQYGVDKVELLPINFDGIALQKGEEWGDEVFDLHHGRLWETFRKQEQVHSTAAIFAPFLAMRAASMGLAGTDVAQHRHFTEAAEVYRRILVKQMNDYMTHHSKTGDWEFTVGNDVWEQVAPFTYTAPSAGWVLRNHALSLSILALWAVAAVALAIFGAARVRLA